MCTFFSCCLVYHLFPQTLPPSLSPLPSPLPPPQRLLLSWSWNKLVQNSMLFSRFPFHGNLSSALDTSETTSGLMVQDAAAKCMKRLKGQKVLWKIDRTGQEMVGQGGAGCACCCTCTDARAGRGRQD